MLNLPKIALSKGEKREKGAQNVYIIRAARRCRTQNYISQEHYTLCSCYLKKGETLEETVVREVFEETGQRVISCEYVQSYYFPPKNLIMEGFIAFVKASESGNSNEVDDLMWEKPEQAVTMVERENNWSGEHLDKCILKLNQQGFSFRGL